MDRPPGGSGGKLGGLAGPRINLHRKKFNFCTIQIILNKINIKFFEKSLDLANFVNFADLPQGGRGYPPTPLLANPGLTVINISGIKVPKMLSKTRTYIHVN